MAQIASFTGETSYKKTIHSDFMGILLKVSNMDELNLLELSEDLSEKITISLVRDGSTKSIATNIPLSVYAVLDANGDGVVPVFGPTYDQISEISILITLSDGLFEFEDGDQVTFSMSNLVSSRTYTLNTVTFPIRSSVVDRISTLNVEADNDDRSFNLNDVSSLCFEPDSSLEVTLYTTNGDALLYTIDELKAIGSRTNEILFSSADGRVVHTAAACPMVVIDAALYEKVRFVKTSGDSFRCYALSPEDFGATAKAVAKNASLRTTIK